MHTLTCIHLGGGKLGPTGGPISCLQAGQPEIAALNSGSLNYLRTRKNGDWAWPPMTFENSVPKIQTMLDAMPLLNKFVQWTRVCSELLLYM